MANPRRGEIAATFGDKDYTLCLTLGALAELEAAFGAQDLVGLVAKFETGRFSAKDLLRVIAIGLRAAGHHLSDEEVAALPCADGLAGYVAITADLLAATFGGASPRPPMPQGQ